MRPSEMRTANYDDSGSQHKHVVASAVCNARLVGDRWLSGLIEHAMFSFSTTGDPVYLQVDWIVTGLRLLQPTAWPVPQQPHARDTMTNRVVKQSGKTTSAFCR